MFLKIKILTFPQREIETCMIIASESENWQDIFFYRPIVVYFFSNTLEIELLRRYHENNPEFG